MKVDLDEKETIRSTMKVNYDLQLNNEGQKKIFFFLDLRT